MRRTSYGRAPAGLPATGTALRDPRRSREQCARRRLAGGREVATSRSISPQAIRLPEEANGRHSLAGSTSGYRKDGQGFRPDERVDLVHRVQRYAMTRCCSRARQRGWTSRCAAPLRRLLASRARRREGAVQRRRMTRRVLVATDVASEGLNLQTSCRYVFHWEIPWNPMRLEQRNGRVDRHGQARDVVAFHFTSDEDEDLKFLDYVVTRWNRSAATWAASATSSTPLSTSTLLCSQ